jgi:hypothetical protein
VTNAGIILQGQATVNPWRSGADPIGDLRLNWPGFWRVAAQFLAIGRAVG